MKRKTLYLFAFVLFFCFCPGLNTYSQDIPDKPNPPHLVNDFAGILNAEEISMLESKLVTFNDSTSTQIAVVIVPSLSGYDKSDYAQRLGEKWGIGKKGLNNGVLILVKPKTPDSNGEVFITTGYGLEGAIPDLTCSEIVNNEMLPAFRNSDYITGLNNAVDVIMRLASGEFSAEQYGEGTGKNKGTEVPLGLIIFVIFIVILLTSGRSGRNNRRNISTGGLPFWMLMGMMGSGRNSHSGSWGGFSGGSGGGGFGGFGGGSFGGGGSGGSW
jgi:uncharacterized protein